MTDRDLQRRMRMSFTTWLAILFLMLFVIDIVAFTKGKETKKWVPCIIVSAIMVVGIVILGYLWFTSPM